MYDENGDDIITLEEMTRLFEDKELGANLYEDLHMFKGVRINTSFAYQITVFLSHANTYTNICTTIVLKAKIENTNTT